MTQTCLAVRYLARGLRPSRVTFYRFRDKSKVFIDDVFKQLLSLAQKDAFLDSGEASIDGTFIDALASRHRLVNQATLDKRQAQIAVKIEEDMQDTTKVDPNPLPAWMAKTPADDWSSSLVSKKPKSYSPKSLLKTAKRRNLSD